MCKKLSNIDVIVEALEYLRHTNNSAYAEQIFHEAIDAVQEIKKAVVKESFTTEKINTLLGHSLNTSRN